MHDEIKSDIPNESGAVLPERSIGLERLIQNAYGRVWAICDNGKGLEIFAPSAMIVVPRNAPNLVFEEIVENNEKSFVIKFQSVHEGAVSNVRLEYFTRGAAENARESLKDYIRNKSRYIEEYIHDSAMQVTEDQKSIQTKFDETPTEENRFRRVVNRFLKK